MSVVTPKQQQSQTRSLDYRSCNVGELRHFIQSRTTLTARAIWKLSKAKMVFRLKKLDTQRTFWRFMDLPPELRLEIYQHRLLFGGQEASKNHSALLRVSEIVHSESEPVLYCINSFRVVVHHTVMKWAVSESWDSEWDLTLAQASGWPRHALPSPVKIDMLFGLRHLTIRLCDMNRHRRRERYDHRRSCYPRCASRSLTSLCFMLSSAARLKTLTITNVPPQTAFRGVDEATELLFPARFSPQACRSQG